MAIRRFEVTATADGDGNAEVYTPVLSGGLHSIRYVKPGSGGYTNGVDFSVTSENTGATLWAEENVNASATRMPRVPLGDATGADALFADEGQETLGMFTLSQDRVKIEVSSAVSGAGTFHITIDEGVDDN